MENTTIQAVKFGSIINCSIGGKLFSKKFGTAEDADRMYREIIRIKQDGAKPSEVVELIKLFNVRLRIAEENGLEYDPDTGSVYLPSHDTPLPTELVELFTEYYEQGYPTQAIVNFWTLLAANPDAIVRERTFDFIRQHDFVITDNGYMLTYKAVYEKEDMYVEKSTVKDDKLYKEVSLAVTKIRSWHKPLSYYWVYRNDQTDVLRTTKSQHLADNAYWSENLDVIWKQVNQESDSPNLFNQDTTFTDMYTQKMEIRLGVPVKMDREQCDANHNNECSYGLHVGATKYVENFGRNNGKVLMCLINPANIVAVPTYDRSKMRVSEYFPIGEAEYFDGKINAIKQSYFENDYINYEREELEKMLETIKVERKNPIKDALNAAKETRLFSELEGLIKNRLVALNTVV